MKHFIRTAIVGLLLFLLLNTTLLLNGWLLLTARGYFIPADSSVFDFNPLIMNEGSGEWWLYGEDEVFYYTVLGEGQQPYLKIRKDETKKCPSFKPADVKTWCKASSFKNSQVIKKPVSNH